MQNEVMAFAAQHGLSPRESEVFGLLVAKIVTFKDIAMKLGLSPSTVNNHFKSIFDKTQTNSKAELLASFLTEMLEKYKNCQHLIKKPNVMVVDDEEDICEFLGAQLTRRGVRVYPFTDPKKAVDALSELRIDSVVTDIRMPGMNGMELLKSIRVAYRYLPSVFFVSGYAEDIGIQKAMHMGASALLDKPIDVNRLFALIMEQFIEDVLIRNHYLGAAEKNAIVLNRDMTLRPIDVGYGGIFIPGMSDFEVGSTLSFRFQLSPAAPSLPSPIPVTGEVMWIRHEKSKEFNAGTGVKFVQIGNSELELVREHVRHHKILSFIPIGAQ